MIILTESGQDGSYSVGVSWIFFINNFFFQHFMSGNIAMAISVSKNLRLPSGVCLFYNRWSAASGKRSVEYHSTSFIYGECFTAPPFN